MGETTIGVSESQKSKLVKFNSILEQEAGKDVSQGEAVAHAATLAIEHVEECQENGQ